MSATYLDYPKAAERAAQLLPSAKIVILLREPTSRLVSSFNMKWQVRTCRKPTLTLALARTFTPTTNPKPNPNPHPNPNPNPAQVEICGKLTWTRNDCYNGITSPRVINENNVAVKQRQAASSSSSSK